MPEFRRWFVEGGMYFFTVVTYGRRPILVTELARTALREALQAARRRWPFDIFAIVLLPDHLHTIWCLPRGDAAYPRRWGWIKKDFTQRWRDGGGDADAVSASQARARRAGVWQRRYWEHVIRDEADMENHVHYIHYNPVKHGLARCPGDWQYSSFARFVAGGEYEPDWGCADRATPSFRVPELRWECE